MAYTVLPPLNETFPEIAPLYSTVKNIAQSEITAAGKTTQTAISQYFGFLPPHGRTLAAGEEITVWGHIQQWLTRFTPNDRARRSLELAISGITNAQATTKWVGSQYPNGRVVGQALAIINTPAVIFKATDTGQIEQLSVAGTTPAGIVPAWYLNAAYDNPPNIGATLAASYVLAKESAAGQIAIDQASFNRYTDSRYVPTSAQTTAYGVQTLEGQIETHVWSPFQTIPYLTCPAGSAGSTSTFTIPVLAPQGATVTVATNTSLTCQPALAGTNSTLGITGVTTVTSGNVILTYTAGTTTTSGPQPMVHFNLSATITWSYYSTGVYQPGNTTPAGYMTQTSTVTTPFVLVLT